MRIELWILLITSLLIYNAYHDGKYTKLLLSYKKYYTMIFYAIIGIGIYILIKKNPHDGKKILTCASNAVKYMQIDKSSVDLISPILNLNELSGKSMPTTNQQNHQNEQGYKIDKIVNSGKNGTKRSVSETKKKYVASIQNWKCGHCDNQLDHTFEIDHKVRLEYGGGNDVNNLIALCRNCHGKKTADENM
jgi:hypothetical protein